MTDHLRTTSISAQTFAPKPIHPPHSLTLERKTRNPVPHYMFATIQRSGSTRTPHIRTGTATLGRNPNNYEDPKSHAAQLQKSFDKARSQPHLGIPSPTSPTHPRSHSAPTDPHTQYKLKTIASTKKLCRFFGSPPPADLGKREIEREGLKAMLRSKVPLCYFLACLVSEFSHESLFFYLEVERYEATPHTAISTLKNANLIYDTYLAPTSPLEVNVDHRVRMLVTTAIRSLSYGITDLKTEHMTQVFAACKRSVVDLLETSYISFLKSPYGEAMKQSCPESGIDASSLTVRRRALKALQQAMEERKTYSGLHCQLLEHMVSSFVLRMLGLDWDGKEVDKEKGWIGKLREAGVGA